jgi:hypothetical protein
MDTGKKGKISKDERMEFLSAECDRPDGDKSGESGSPSIAAIAGGVRHVCPSGRSGQGVEPDSVEQVGNEILQHKEWFQCLKNAAQPARSRLCCVRCLRWAWLEDQPRKKSLAF